MENIPEIRHKGKLPAGRFVGQWGIAIVLIVVGVASFELGRLSTGEHPAPPIAVGAASSSPAR